MSSHHQSDIETKVVHTWNSGGKWIALALVLALVGWGVHGIIKSQELKREGEAFSALYSIEKTYRERKAAFDRGEILKTQKAEDLGMPAELAKDSKLKTGDVEKDYGDIITDLKAFSKAHQGTQAAALAGVWLMDIYSSYDKWDQAGAALSDVSSHLKSDTMLAGLLEMSTATALAEAGKCAEAVVHWNNILNNESMTYLHGESALRSGLCLEKAGDFDGAAAKYRVASEKAVTGSSVAATADQFLRALEVLSPSDSKEKSL